MFTTIDYPKLKQKCNVLYNVSNEVITLLSSRSNWPLTSSRSFYPPPENYQNFEYTHWDPPPPYSTKWISSPFLLTLQPKKRESDSSSSKQHAHTFSWEVWINPLSAIWTLVEILSSKHVCMDLIEGSTLIELRTKCFKVKTWLRFHLFGLIEVSLVRVTKKTCMWTLNNIALPWIFEVKI